ncbi:CHASE3 domain-containing protein [Vibrio profundi]|uniref:CHASE3 domain-containing protein n=1 Tax=Vibrio profundi TaxID=1774960 RepID=UPI003734C157
MITQWFDDLPLRKKLLLSFFCPVVLMLAVSVTVYNNTQSMVKDSHWVIHTHKAIARAQELLVLTVDMETGQRGFLLTGDDKFLEPYELAIRVWDKKLSTLSYQVRDNPAQVERLKVIDKILQTWLFTSGRHEIEQRRLIQSDQASLNTVINLVKEETGKNLIDQIRVQLADFIKVEETLIDVRVEASDRSAETTTLVLFMGSTLAATISIFVAFWSAIRLNYRLGPLVSASKEVALGRLNESLAIIASTNQTVGKDEIAELTLSFHDMAANLIENDHKVKERTKQLTKERAKAESAARAKSEFLSTMSHEIRTPMNGVLGIAQIIASESNETITKRNIALILESGEHLMTILNDILDFSKIEENKVVLEHSAFNLSQVLNPVCGSLQPLADEKNIQLVIKNEVMAGIEFTGDCARLRQILLNLGSNAIKFTGIGHVLFHVTLDKEKSRLFISVNDTGIGIPKEKQAHIFNAFEQADTSTTRQFGGTGLGLTIVSKLIELMHGTITLKSAEGLGAHFLIELPIVWCEPKQIQAPTLSPPEIVAKTQNLHVLLVEDNEVNAIVAKRFCENLGHTVTLAKNGKIATELVQKSQFDLILMDNHMPEMNGVEATHYLREQLGIKTLLFAYTADVFREAHDNFIEAGADHVLTKPLQKQSFIDALEQFAHRIPSHTHSETINHTENVVHLDKKPIEKLRMTEEELTTSPIVTELRADKDSLLPLIETTVFELQKSVDCIIEQFYSQDWQALKRTLHTVKGTALSLGLEHLAALALELESQLKANQAPDSEFLQKFLNRLQVNIHQGQRIIDSCRAGDSLPLSFDQSESGQR